MLEATFWGLVGGLALVVGAEIAFAVPLRGMVIGLIMSFGIGTLISSVAFELVEESLTVGDDWLVGLGLAAGALAFFLGDRAIAKSGGADRKNPEGASGDEGSGMGIALGSALDGVPESAALGISLAAGGGVSVPLLAAIFISNLPESLGSSLNLVNGGHSRTWVRTLWWLIAGLSALSAGVGYWAVTASDTPTGAFVQAFAGGALLTMILDEMAPEAFRKSAIYTGLATTGGFTFAVWLSTFE